MFLGPLIQSSKDSDSDSSLPNYAVTSLLILFLCMLYWLFMFKLLPWFFNYSLKQETITLHDGMTVHQWEKSPNETNSAYEPLV